MSKVIPLISIGSQVKIAPEKVRDRVPRRLSELLSEQPFGTVVDYKMTDGTSIGFILELSDGSISWFFQEELKILEEGGASLALINEKAREVAKGKIIEYPIINTNNIIDILNPFNFLRWLLYSLKDIY
ncbi:DUF2862 domain-containing protein [Prochlorococcus sp. MIT 1307]|uniref:cytochrome b6f subunit PetP n=1 Tax=Prochlorococcus sp. MIT 1307 TaxID=3096219 RepID=UPI002A74769D|nr:DUF2862 domain-containing protein [Prochlorococcus sp. MIT 1307]